MMTFVRKLFCSCAVVATLLLVGCLEYESQELQRIRVEEKSEYVPNLIAVQDQLPELVDAEAVAALRVEFLGTPKRKRSLGPWRR